MTCLCCKSLKHIPVSRVVQHLSDHKIFVESQLGFRSGRSCETQLVQFIHDLQANLVGAQNRGQNWQTSLLWILPRRHCRLIYKPEYYSIWNYILWWLPPPGSYARANIFLNLLMTRQTIYTHQFAFFADDCVLYKNIRRSKDQQLLQDYLDKLTRWGEAWFTKLNVKSHSMRVTGHPPQKQIIHGYTLQHQVLENVSSAKDLGVKTSNDH